VKETDGKPLEFESADWRGGGSARIAIVLIFALFGPLAGALAAAFAAVLFDANGLYAVTLGNLLFLGAPAYWVGLLPATAAGACVAAFAPHFGRSLFAGLAVVTLVYGVMALFSVDMPGAIHATKFTSAPVLATVGYAATLACWAVAIPLQRRA